MRILERKDETKNFEVKTFRRGVHAITYEISLDDDEKRFVVSVTFAHPQTGMPVYSGEVLMDGASSVDDAFAMVEEAMQFAAEEAQSFITRQMLQMK